MNSGMQVLEGAEIDLCKSRVNSVHVLTSVALLIKRLVKGFG